ncbi:uncharacterized protein LOC135296918 [Passer domesticus]|uniref:uncharacterized protein LOC135296918 n=1 Tax=Passer domesticus TaxID=48849 RepID=UPI0030FEA468
MTEKKEKKRREEKRREEKRREEKRREEKRREEKRREEKRREEKREKEGKKREQFPNLSFTDYGFLETTQSTEGASRGSEAPAARGAVCQCMGSLGQSTPLLPEPLDGEETLHRARWDLLLWCQSQGEQVTFISLPHQLTPLPQRTKRAETRLAQLPHKSSSAPNLFHCPHDNHFTFCDCEFQLTTQGADRPS